MLIQLPLVPFHEAITMLNVSLSFTIADSCTTSFAFADVSFIATVNVGVASATANVFSDDAVNVFTTLNTFAVADATPTFTVAINDTSANANEVVQLSAMVNDSDTLSMVIASWNGTSGSWINISNTTTLAAGVNYSVNSSVGLARGNTIGWLFYSNDSVVNTFTASSLNTFAVADATPTFTVAINDTSANADDVVQLSAMVNDSDTLSMVIASWNGTSGVWINISNTTTLAAGVNYSVNSSVGLARGNTIGWLFYSNDSVVNTFTASSLNTFAVADA